jgi:hypothetical protein
VVRLGDLIDNGSLREGVRQAWLPLSVLRPARSDINFWNDGPWRWIAAATAPESLDLNDVRVVI